MVFLIMGWYNLEKETEVIFLSKLVVGFWNRSVYLTYLELLIAVMGITLALNNNYLFAVICLALCGVCDMFDGKIARATKRTEDEKTFGIQIDSLCDMVSFGVLPAVIGYSAGVHGIAILVLMVYVLAALVRLAYFNVTEQHRQETTDENRKSFEGLPVTWSAVIIPVISILKLVIAKYFAIVYGIVLFLTAVAFVGRFKVIKPQI